jgi:putative hemolysin
MLDLFRQQAANLAIVLDEYGGVLGIVTPRDIFAAIAGQFAEDADADPGITRRNDGSWLVDGRVRMVDLERAIGARGLASPEYATVAGLVLHHMERLPNLGESMTFGGHRFEVVDLDARRIDKVLVTALPKNPEIEI